MSHGNDRQPQRASHAFQELREATGIKPGDRVEMRTTASGAVIIEKPGTQTAYEAKLRALMQRRPIRDITTDELMDMSRGESAEFRSKK